MSDINLQARSNPEIDYGKSDKPFVVCRFITECSKWLMYVYFLKQFCLILPSLVNKLSAKVTTQATALCLFHKYNAANPHPSYDPYVSVKLKTHFKLTISTNL